MADEDPGPDAAAPQAPTGTTSTGSSVAALLASTEALAGDAALADIATRLFEFTQFLLDDDENLTKVGNLDGGARERLRARCLELLGVAPATTAGTDDSADDSADAADVTTDADGGPA